MGLRASQVGLRARGRRHIVTSMVFFWCYWSTIATAFLLTRASNSSSSPFCPELPRNRDLLNKRTILILKAGSHYLIFGQRPDRGQSPVEWGDFLSRSSVRSSPHWASQPGLRPSQPGLRLHGWMARKMGNLLILHYFFLYRDRWPASPIETKKMSFKNKSKSGQGNR